MACARLLIIAIALVGVPASVSAGEWPQFRGPQSNGLSVEQQLPIAWSADSNVGWTAKVPGTGWSSPIIWDDKVFISTAVADPETLPPPRERGRGNDDDDDDEGEEGEEEEEEEEREPPTTVYSWELYCLDRNTGEILWNKVAHEGNPLNHTQDANTCASETPVTDGEFVFVHFGMVGVFCYDFSGTLIWKKYVGAVPMLYDFGTASSPALGKNNFFLQIDNGEESFLVALDKKTGEEQWRKPRAESSNWSSPIIWNNKFRNELVTSGQTARSYDPATGDLLWSLNMPGRSTSASPAGDGDRLILGTQEEEEPGYLISVRAGATGDITPSKGELASEGAVWMQKNAGPSMASPLLYRDSVYVLDNRGGNVNCYDIETGAPRYQDERLAGARAFWASPWGYDGKVFCLDDSGTTYLLEAGAELNLLATNKIKGKFWASPAMSDGGIVLRGTE